MAASTRPRNQKRKATRESARRREDYARLAQLIARARTEFSKEKPSQARLAELIGTDQTWVAKAERGARRVDLLELIEMLDALEIDIHDFIDLLRRHRLERPIRKDR